MKRYQLEKMKEWMESSTRKPMVLRGARQVGKTWLVRALAHELEMQLIEINFEKQRHLETLFESNEPTTILLNLESILNITIDPDKCILFLDEIQAAPELIAKLRWFYEGMPKLAVIAAGSLLEFVLEDYSFSMPVGRIQYFYVEPMGFEEYLLAKDEKHLLEAIKKTTIQHPLNSIIHNKANQLFKEFVLVGGMPESVHTWISTGSLEALSAVQHHLISTYQDDFAKYAGKLSIQYLEDVLRAIPILLSKKFMYSQVDSIAQHAGIKQALELLSKSRLCHKVYHSAANGIPLGAEINPKSFKMLLLDIGLVSSMLDLKLHQIHTIDDLLLINKGALAEQVTGQLLRLLFPYYHDPKSYYWSRETKGSHAEIDYLIQNQIEILPIEVKAGAEGKLRSLHQFMYEKSMKKAIRIYSGPLQKDKIHVKTTQGNAVDYELLSLPFYLISEIYRFL